MDAYSKWAVKVMKRVKALIPEDLVDWDEGGGWTYETAAALLELIDAARAEAERFRDLAEQRARTLRVLGPPGHGVVKYVLEWEQNSPAEVSASQPEPPSPPDDQDVRRIRCSSLCMRFYRKDGWSRAKVAELGVDPKHVSLRHFDSWLDSRLREGAENPRFDGTFVDYYAVHDKVHEEKMDVSEHEVIPFHDGGLR